MSAYLAVACISHIAGAAAVHSAAGSLQQSCLQRGQAPCCAACLPACQRQMLRRGVQLQSTQLGCPVQAAPGQSRWWGPW